MVLFDLQFNIEAASSRLIRFVISKTELIRLRNNRKSLWCEGNTVCVVDDHYKDDEMPVTKKPRFMNSGEAKAKS